MRLARLAASGLAIGVIAGFAIALLRPRPHVRTEPLEGHSSSPAADAALWARFQQAERDQQEHPAPTLDVRSGPRVTG